MSHQWVGDAHPDPEFRQTKVLQDALRPGVDGTYWGISKQAPPPPCRHMMSDLQHIRQDIHAEMLMPNSGLRGSELRSAPLFLWYDYFSCPQIEKKDLPKAIDSIPGYIARCAFFFVLAPVIEAPSLSKVFTPSTWADRAWCRVERLCRALSQEGSFILIKSHTQFELSSTHVGSFGGPPGEGSFSVTADRSKLGPVLQKALQRKLLMLLEAADLVGYRVIFNLQSVLLRGFMVQPIHTIVPAKLGCQYMV